MKKIETKISGLLALAAAVSLILCLVVSYFSIRAGLPRLLMGLELEKLKPWARSLEVLYENDKTWDSVRGHKEELFPNSPNLGLESRVSLFDQNGQNILGASQSLEKRQSLELKDKSGLPIGYLMVAAPPRGYLDAHFAKHYLAVQARTLLLVGVTLVVLCLILARIFARNLLRPIKALIEGARVLAAGDYQFQLPNTKRLDELGDLTNSFDRLAKTLEAAEKSRQEWVADTSHELRTPLAVLQAEIEALQDGIHEPTPEKFAVLHREVVGLNTLVNQLNELAKADVGGLAYRFCQVDLGKLVAETTEGFRERFSQLELKVEITVKGTCLVDGDKERLRQMWQNLLENCLQYTDSPGQVKIEVSKQGGQVFITIQDSAPGVSDEHLGRLFDRFFRADPSRTRGRGGTGIGLALVKKVVEAHRGSIHAAHSKLGGVRLELEFPLMEKNTK